MTHDTVGPVTPFVFDMVFVDDGIKFTDKDYEKNATEPVNGDGTWDTLVYLVSPKHEVGTLELVFLRVLKGKRTV